MWNTEALGKILGNAMALDTRNKALLLLLIVVVLFVLVRLIVNNGDVTSISNTDADMASSGPVEIASQDSLFGVEAVTLSGLHEHSNAEQDEHAMLLLQEQFAQANELSRQQQWSKAEDSYLSLIEKHPSRVELYVNLSVVYANSDRLEEARQILTDGLSAAPVYSILHANMQAILGALAAQAYRQALAEKQKPQSFLDLRLINDIELQTSDLSQQAELQTRVVQLEDGLNTATDRFTDLQEQSSERIAELEAQVSELSLALVASDHAQKLVQNVAQSVIDVDQNDIVDELAVSTLDTQKVKAVSADSELPSEEVEIILEDDIDIIKETEEGVTAADSLASEAVAELSEVSDELIADTELATELAPLVVEPGKPNEQIDTGSMIESVTTAELAQAELAPVREINVGPVAAQSTLSDVNEVTQDEREIAIELVQEWARRWSNQNVAGFIDCYDDNYSSLPGQLSHDQWLSQHKTDISDKEFIQVDVSDFDITKSQAQFSVTFTQRYRTDAIDDTVRKKLVFAMQRGSWLDAKIINETIVTNAPNAL